jgi:membrane-associated phospholipid phosphatase
VQLPSSTSAAGPGRIAFALYFVSIALLVVRIAYLDDWSLASWAVLSILVATFPVDRVPSPTTRGLVSGVAFFGVLCAAIAYMPDLWFEVAYRLNHAEHYLWNANAFMRSIPGNDAHFLWGYAPEVVTRAMRWVYLSGFDMVLWIPVVRSLLAFDSRKMARYALGAHLIQFPLIMPFYTALRVDEVWSVLGHADRCERGWSDEVRRDLGANCFPSMHTSVACAILLLSLREKSLAYRILMCTYCVSIALSTMVLEVHWVLDVCGGVALAVAAVKLTDLVIQRVEATRERSPSTVPACASKAV